MKAKIDLKVCGVCGDKALGYNFNAVTCESCKAFFRRNALIQKEFKCPFTNQCKITTVTRRFCQKCRLDKCFSIGMCKDLIMSEEDKVLKRQKIEQNRAKKKRLKSFKSGFKKVKKESVEADSQDCDIFSSSYTDSDSKDTSFSEGYQSNNTNVILSGVNSMNNSELARTINEDSVSSNDRLVSSSDDFASFENILSSQQHNSGDNQDNPVDNALFTNLMNNNSTNYNNNTLGNDSLRNKPQQSQNKPIDITEDVVKHVQGLHSFERNSSNPVESILCEAIKLEYEAYSSITRCSSFSRDLNDAERAKLNELIVANKALLSPVDEDISVFGTNFKNASQTDMPEHQREQPTPALIDVINLTAVAIRRLIKMAKKINAFKNMCQEDQVALLKGGCTEIMMIRSAMIYDLTKKTWEIPHSQETLNVNVEVLKRAKGNAYKELDQFIRSFDPKWRTDENIILILCAIVLFTPDRPRVIHQDVIKLEQNSYYYLLRRYLESIYVGCEAKSTFLKLIQKIMELHKLNEELINIYLDVNPSQVEPLLIEIFDLKPY